MEGGAHLDAATGEQIAPATVVVQFADVEAIPDDPKLRLDVNLVGGSGELVDLQRRHPPRGHVEQSRAARRRRPQWLDDRAAAAAWLISARAGLGRGPAARTVRLPGAGESMQKAGVEGAQRGRQLAWRRP